jgi:hypothetical protein
MQNYSPSNFLILFKNLLAYNFATQHRKLIFILYNLNIVKKKKDKNINSSLQYLSLDTLYTKLKIFVDKFLFSDG